MKRNLSPRRVVEISNRVRGLKIPRGSIARIILALDTNGRIASPPPGALSIAFLGLRAMGRLHARFLDDPSPTDVITFPGVDPDADGGEICICPEMAARNARDSGMSFTRELTLYLVHGWLHLAGFDDRSDTDRAAMRHSENQLMDFLQDSKAIPDFTWNPAPAPTRQQG